MRFQAIFYILYMFSGFLFYNHYFNFLNTILFCGKLCDARAQASKDPYIAGALPLPPSILQN